MVLWLTVSYFKGMVPCKATVLSSVDSSILLLISWSALLDCYRDEEWALVPVCMQGVKAPWVSAIGYWSHCAAMQLAELSAEVCLASIHAAGAKLWRLVSALWDVLCDPEHLWRDTPIHIGTVRYSLKKKKFPIFISMRKSLCFKIPVFLESVS